MNVSSHEEYGLRCALQLARAFGKGPVPASRVSQEEGISVEYVSKFMHLFRKAELVSSSRGTQGGFQLNRAPSEIPLREVLEALDPRGIAAKNFCAQFAGQKESCVNLNQCSIRPLWALITYYFDSILEKIYLSDLLEGEDQVKQIVESVLLKCIEDSKNIKQESVAAS